MPVVMQIQGFPTLMLVDSKGEIIPFEGERTKDSIVQFIEEKAAGINSAPSAKEEL